jgi:hypothetical protein
MWVVKTDGGGAPEWSRSYGVSSADETAWDVEPVPGGAFVLAGKMTNALDGATRAVVVKIDGQGNEEWSQMFGDRDSEAFSILIAPDGGYVFAGSILTDTGDRDVYLVRFISPSGVMSTPEDQSLASGRVLGVPWPNPAGGAINYTVNLRDRGRVRVEVFDVSGRLVQTVLEEVLEKGLHVLRWDPAADRGISSGMYMMRLVHARGKETRKLLVFR